MAPTEPNILWPEVTKFVRQLNHDLRNYLNAVELQTALLGEIVEEPEAKGEIKRLREMTGAINAHLHRLSAKLARIRPELMRYRAADFAEDLRAKLNLEQPEQSAAIDWRVSLGEEALEIDPQLLTEAFLELFANAGTHGRGKGPLVFEIRAAGQVVELSLREPKAQLNGATDQWGARPLQEMRSGHYGLGLFRARGIFEAHHGQYRVHFDPAASVLQTTVTLPCNGGQ
jgi:light-regulated signal transduction histidine kinase (bacteriophytochrome)